MASIIRVKRSTGTAAPSSLNFGELGLTVGAGTHGNKGGRLFVGDSNDDVREVGGRYFTDLLSIAPGLVAGQVNPTTAANGFAVILDSNRKVDQWNVDNLTLDGNTFSSTNTDGDIVLNPNGAGEINIPDDTFLSFGDGKDAKIEYDEDGTNKVQVTGAGWVYNGIPVEFQGGGGIVIDNIGISSNVISSKSGASNTLFIDPYPDGLDSDGLVVIKGSLQVDGTTTNVNSTTATVNDSMINLGDITSQRTIMAPVVSGVSTVKLDSLVGINTGDLISGHPSLPTPTGTPITQYNVEVGIVTFTGTTNDGISTTTQLTVTHAFDTNTDRGVSFNYNTSTGVAGIKTGFFGYDDTHSRWTYIPDANITGSVATGTKGFLDIKGIYYQAGDFQTSGVVYFDSTGLQKSTVTPASGISTSNAILTTDASGVPTWTSTIDGGEF